MAPRMRMERLRKLVDQQFGAIARWQILSVGFAGTQIRDWLRTGRLFRRYPGVYSWGRADLPEAGELAASLLFAGHGSVLGGITQLWWRGYLHRRPRLTHIDAPGFARSRPGLRIRHPGLIQRSMHQGLPVSGTPSALLVAAADLSHNSLRLVIARAEFDRKITLSAIEAACGRGIVGSSKLRAALAAHLPQLARCANALEREFVLLCEAHGLPIPEPNERIGRYRPDMLWADRMLIVELDGPRAHSTPAQLIADGRRQEFLESLGYTVVRFTDEDVFRRPSWVMAQTRAALAAA